MERKFCFHCGVQLPVEANFCFKCGTKQEIGFMPSASNEDAQRIEEEVILQEPNPSVFDDPMLRRENDAAEAPNKKGTKKSKGFALGKSIAVLAISVLMLIMSFFPVFQMQFEMASLEMPVMLSPIDNFVFLLDSLQSVDAEELTDTRLYEDYLDVQEELNHELRRIAEKGDLSMQSLEYDDLSGYAKGLFNSSAILAVRLGLQIEDVSPSPMFIIIAVLSLVYILICIALVIVSVLHLLSVLGVFKEKKEFGSKSTIALLCAVPMILALLYLAMFFRYSYGVAGTSLAWAGIVTVVSFGVLLAGLITYRFVILGHRPRLSSIIKHGLSTVVAVVLLFLLTSPVFVTAYEAVFADKITKKEESFSTNASFFEDLYLTDSQREFCESICDDYNRLQFDNLMEGHFDALKAYDAKDFREGDAAAANLQLLIHLSAAAEMHEFYWLFYLICIFYLLISAGACLSLWCHVTWFAGGGYQYRVDRGAKLASCISATLALTLAIVFIVLIGSYLDKFNYDKFYAMGISAGIIVMTVFAIGSVFFPSRIKDAPSAKKIMNEEYTND